MTRALLIAAGAAALLAGPHLPYGWGHALSEGCSWRTRPFLGFVGPLDPDPGAERAEFRCWQRHGLASPSPFVKTVLPRWPSKAELAAWRNDDAGELRGR